MLYRFLETFNNFKNFFEYHFIVCLKYDDLIVVFYSNNIINFRLED